MKLLGTTDQEGSVTTLVGVDGRTSIPCLKCFSPREPTFLFTADPVYCFDECL